MAELLLHLNPICKNRTLPYWKSTSGFDFDYWTSWVWYFASAY